jgi:UDP-2,3-diacylglucosamine pyrophosphatase LpxH
VTDHTGEDVVLVSDLHLGPGPLHCVETFFHDAELCRFLDSLVARAGPEGRSWRLVVLGDFLDFLRCELVTNDAGGAPTEDVALATLDRIVANHPDVFRGLGRFLAAGFPVDIVLGNHDAELVRPALQERLRTVLAEAGAGPAAADSVRFHPWIYHLPGVLYAEHGSQHDGFNCFSTVLDPYEDGPPGRLERPIGTFLFEAVERLVYSIDPCPDHVSSPLRYYWHAARREPGAAVDAVVHQLKVFTDLWRHARSISGPEWDARRAAYRDGALEPHAKEVGLSAAAVAAIDEMSSASERPVSLLMQEAVKINTRRSGPALAILALGYVATRRGGVRALTMGGAAAGSMSFIRKGLPLSPTGRHVMYLQRAAMRIHDLLEREGAAVPYYVFAHTHAAQHLPLGFGPGAPQYLNTGTWSCLAPPAAETLRTIRPTFVHVMPARDGAPGTARLMAWNASSESAETLRFQA